MATIGLSKPYYALYNPNSGNPTYSGGGKLGKATELTLELDDAESNILYADNGPAESDNQFTGGSLSVSTDDLLPAPMLAVLGLKLQAMNLPNAVTPSPQWLVYDDDQEIPYVGFGGIMKAKQSNVVKWIAVVFLKIQFSNPGVSAVTQGETIEWQTKTLSANVMRDDGPKHRWQMMSTPMDTEADAEAAIKQVLNIQDAGEPTLGTLTVTSAAGTASGTTNVTVTPALTYGNSYVYQVGADITLPTTYGEDMIEEGWTPWNGMAPITAENGNKIGVVEIDAAGGAVAAGETTVTANTGT